MHQYFRKRDQVEAGSARVTESTWQCFSALCTPSPCEGILTFERPLVQGHSFCVATHAREAARQVIDADQR